MFAPEFANFGEDETLLTDVVILLTSWVGWEYMRTMLASFRRRDAEQNLIGALRTVLVAQVAMASARVRRERRFRHLSIRFDATPRRRQPRGCHDA